MNGVISHKRRLVLAARRAGCEVLCSQFLAWRTEFGKLLRSVRPMAKLPKDARGLAERLLLVLRCCADPEVCGEEPDWVRSAFDGSYWAFQRAFSGDCDWLCELWARPISNVPDAFADKNAAAFQHLADEIAGLSGTSSTRAARHGLFQLPDVAPLPAVPDELWGTLGLTASFSNPARQDGVIQLLEQLGSLYD